MSKPQRTLSSFANVTLRQANHKPPRKRGWWSTWNWPVIGILLGVVGFWAGVVWLIDWWWSR